MGTHAAATLPGLQAATHARRESRGLALSAEERAALDSLLGGCKPNSALARRIRIVLACAEPGATETGVAAALGVSPTQVVTWRTLFHQRRCAAFARPGNAARRPRRDGDAVERVVAMTLAARPPDGKPWSTRRMARLVGVSHVRVWQIWRDHGIGPAPTSTG